MAATVSGHQPKTRFLTARHLDGRTLAMRRVRQMQKAIQKELGRKPTLIEASAIERVCVLAAVAEDGRARFLGNKPGAPSLNDIVRAENVAARAFKSCMAMLGAKRTTTSLQALLRPNNAS
jgi:hypothetical protein